MPQRHQQYVRTSNLAERAFVEERWRTKVVPPLFEEHSLVQLVFAVLIRVSDRWNKKGRLTSRLSRRSPTAAVQVQQEPLAGYGRTGGEG